MQKKSYADIATLYAQEVTDGFIEACLYVKQACKRHLDDLQRAKNERGFEFEFSAAHANRACSFIELMPHVKGELANQRKLIKLEPWQVFIVASIFGWIDFNNKRRYRYAYVEVSRKNAKSTLAAGIGLYMGFADGEMGAEVYSAATTRDQARMVFDVARGMVNKRRDMQKTLGIQAGQHAISSAKTNSTFKPVSRDYGGNLDGLNIHCAVIDELHAHKTDDTYEVMATGMGAREQPLLFAITTAGYILDGVCYENRLLVTKVLSKLEAHERYFGIIYTIDEGDSWEDKKAWKKANPNYGVSVFADGLEAEFNRAKISPSATADFKTKHLNLWVSARSGWLDMSAYDAAGDSSLQLADMKGIACFGGLDLASKKDLTCKTKQFVKIIDGVSHYYLFADFYINRARLDDSTNPNQKRYLQWESEGWLTVTDGNITDFEYIERDITDDKANYNLVEAGYDPFNATYFAMRMQEAGIDMVEVPQNVRFLSEPMKHIQALLADGRFHHDNNPIMRWCMSNVTVKTDANENIFPRKDNEHSKIDGAIAAIISTNRAYHYDQVGDIPTGEVTDEQFNKYLSNIIIV